MKYRFAMIVVLLMPMLAPVKAMAFQVSTQNTAIPLQTGASRPQIPQNRPSQNRPAFVVTQDEEYAVKQPALRLGDDSSLSITVHPRDAIHTSLNANGNDRAPLTHFYGDRQQGAVAAAPVIPGLALSSPSVQRPGQGPAIGAVLSRQATDNLKFQGGYNWNAPSKYAGIGSQYDASNFSPETFDPQGYKGSYSFALGAQFQQTKQLSFRGGVQYDSNNPNLAAVQAPSKQSPRALAAVGASYLLGSGAAVDLAASHVFFQDGMMGVAQKLSEDPSNDAQLQLKGKAFTHDNVIKVQLRWKFK